MSNYPRPVTAPFIPAMPSTLSNRESRRLRLLAENAYRREFGLRTVEVHIEVATTGYCQMGWRMWKYIIKYPDNMVFYYTIRRGVAFLLGFAFHDEIRRRSYPYLDGMRIDFSEDFPRQ